MYKDGRPDHYIDAQDETLSSWPRYVNCARYETEQNVAAYQYLGNIYYRSYKLIKAGSELLVWYGEDYAQELGINRDYKIKPIIVNGESKSLKIHQSFISLIKCLWFQSTELIIY